MDEENKFVLQPRSEEYKSAVASSIYEDLDNQSALERAIKILKGEGLPEAEMSNRERRVSEESFHRHRKHIVRERVPKTGMNRDRIASSEIIKERAKAK